MMLIIKDMIRTADGTECVIDATEVNSAIPEHLFSSSAIQR